MSNTKKLTRRRFLRYGTLATTATLALPTIAPRRVLGSEAYVKEKDNEITGSSPH